jgi:hypothetical protein
MYKTYDSLIYSVLISYKTQEKHVKLLSVMYIKHKSSPYDITLQDEFMHSDMYPNLDNMLQSENSCNQDNSF